MSPSGVAHFRPVVRLTKAEAFGACQALADADRMLVAAGNTAEASALGDLFELLEERLSGVVGSAQPCSGSKSTDSEFTQYR